LLSTDVNIRVMDAETNFDLPDGTVTINGITYSAPYETMFVPGTVLNMMAFTPGDYFTNILTAVFPKILLWFIFLLK